MAQDFHNPMAVHLPGQREVEVLVVGQDVAVPDDPQQGAGARSGRIPSARRQASRARSGSPERRSITPRLLHSRAWAGSRARLRVKQSRAFELRSRPTHAVPSWVQPSARSGRRRTAAVSGAIASRHRPARRWATPSSSLASPEAPAPESKRTWPENHWDVISESSYQQAYCFTGSPCTLVCQS
jgi:hypothetical protein